MKILESKFVQGFIKMANDGYLQGWHERNGGNLSYRLKPEEVEMIRPRLNTPGAVSYTHLDVYKRQPLSTISCFC